MDINTFNNIISNQTEISFDVARKQIKKVTKICGFLNLRGYESLETPVKPVQVRGEIRLIEPNDTYSVYLKKDEDGHIPYSKHRKWFGEYNEYLIENIGKGCAYVFKK
jgi:hypothetical protein